MSRLICQVESCERNALVAFGTKWICGECMMKIIENRKKEQNKEVEMLE